MFWASGSGRLRRVLQSSARSSSLLHHRLQLLRGDQRRETGRDHPERPPRPAPVTAAGSIALKHILRTIGHPHSRKEHW